MQSFSDGMGAVLGHFDESTEASQHGVYDRPEGFHLLLHGASQPGAGEADRVTHVDGELCLLGQELGEARGELQRWLYNKQGR